ncbi:oxidoreductase [Wenzhouxiangella sp. XN201]|uniref:ferredoxin reductase family protein n=1 Tax=Wenzhouxiangella sp. XN201 TaxID=2710755 RepID=UPI0013CA7C70|nr:ferric reductase-like transmembrane domain-containing protein [Wenzhouxiangella sp. XN201]NEZ03790.1 oxidoreductase [Wenzhouxiangella sp. XN201]
MQNISARMAHRLVWLIALLPAGLFLFTVSPGDLNSTGAVLQTAGRLTGVAGLSLLLVAAILSARVPGFDRPFGGLTRLWRTHHRLGACSLILLLLHPLLLAFAAAGDGVSSAAMLLFPPLSDHATWSGWIALILMMVFLAPSFSFFGRPRYERWKRLHRLSGPAVVLALAHNFWLSRAFPPWLDITLWSLLALLAVGAVAWRFAFSRHAGRRAYTVQAVEPVTNNVVELALAPLGRRLEHEAGNFVYLTLYDQTLAIGRGEEHPYTISSAPGEDRMRIAIKALGDASRAVQSLKLGGRATVEGPYGRFFVSPDRVVRPEIWVAGGIGITPFLARMRHLRQTEQGADACLIYCVQDEAREIFAGELRDLAQAIEGFELNLHYFYREGPLSYEYLEQVCPDLAEREIYICGPGPLNRLVRDHANRAGIPESRIHTEEFELL